MKNLLLFVSLLLCFQTTAQFDFDIGLDGFDRIRIGSTKEDLNQIVKMSKRDRVDYAWNPSDIGDSRLKNYEFQNDDDAHFHGLKIATMQLAFDEEAKLFLAAVTIDVKDMNQIVKSQLIGSMIDMFGETDCSYSVSYDPPPAYCSWGWDDPTRITMSDMESPGGGPGKTMHFVFRKSR